MGAVYADRLACRGQDLIPMSRDATQLDALAERLRARSVVVADLPARRNLLRVEDPFAWSRSDNARLAMGSNLFVARAAGRSKTAGDVA